MGSAILNAERPRRSGPFREHGVHVGHEENSSVAGAGECGDDVVANRRLGWNGFDLSAEFLQLRSDDCAHRLAAVLVPGAGIDVDEPLP